MAHSPGQTGPNTGTIDAIEEDYFVWHADGAPFSVHMHRDAVDGMARDALEASQDAGVEIGGLMLGHVEPGERPVVWIERYQRVECGHHFGPGFILDDTEHRNLEGTADSITAASELSVVGLYRSDTRPAFQLEAPDFELIGRYFKDPTDLMLLIKPDDQTGILGQFWAHDHDMTVRPAGEAFPFRGRGIGPLDSAPEDDEQTSQTHIARDRPRRLVPDFVPAAVQARPDRAFAPLPPAPQPEFVPTLGFFGKWWPLMGAILLVGGAAWFLLGSAFRTEPAPNPVETNVAVRPLGLYVDPTGSTWRVSWNTAATSLRGARSIALLVRDGDDQNRIDLTPQALQSGTWQYQPKGHDVTFRLETTDAGGHISAESFRLVRTEVAAPKPSIANVSAAPRATHRVSPVIPASIRPRIKAPVSIDVRVQIDTQGRVTSANPVSRRRSGLESYLADRALIAAKQWKFEPARAEGKAVPGAETIHFVFER